MLALLQASTRSQLQASAQQIREERADRASKEQDAADAIALRDEAIQELKVMLADEKVSRCGGSSTTQSVFSEVGDLIRDKDAHDIVWSLQDANSEGCCIKKRLQCLNSAARHC